MTVNVVAGSSGKNDSRSQLSRRARFSHVSSNNTERCPPAVQQFNRALLGIAAQGEGKAGGECIGGRLDVAQIQVGGVGAKFARIEGKLMQQRGLTDAARAIYVHHIERRIRSRQRCCKQLLLGSATDKQTPALRFQAFRDTGGHLRPHSRKKTCHAGQIALSQFGLRTLPHHTSMSNPCTIRAVPPPLRSRRGHRTRPAACRRRQPARPR